jgi:hypothetical protein
MSSHSAAVPFVCKAIPAAIALLVLSCSAGAQTAPTGDKPAATSAQPAVKADAKTSATSTQQPGEVAVVNVVSERQTNRLDRQVYDIKNDASTAGASVGDVLNNVPSVNVDPNGTVRLRGSERVTVLVDGKPTAQLQGDARAAAINALPAENYESVQVINNPGAEFGNEAGGGPILNLISRRYTKPGGNGAVVGSVAPGGRYNASANGSYSAGYASVNGNLTVRRDGNDMDMEDVRERIDPATGAVSRLRQTSNSSNMNTFVQAGVGGRYNYNEHDTVTGSVSVNKRGNDGESTGHITDYRTGQTPVVDYLQRGKSDGSAHNYEVVTGFEHRFNTDGETFKIDLRHSSNTNPTNTATRYEKLTMPATGAPVLNDYARNAENRVRLTDLSTDYSGKAGPGFMNAGGRWQRTDQDFDNRYIFLNGNVVDTRRSNLFKLKQDVVALYGTYEMPINPLWSFKSGLRIERTDLDLNQVTTNIQASNAYTSYLPSLFLTYKLDKNTNLRLSYADRISRPNAGDLNPFINYSGDGYSASSGNPGLHAVKLHSLELGYETRVMGLMPVSVRGYMRQEADVITERRLFLNESTLLTSRVNEGDRRSGGLEFSLMGMIPPGMKISGIALPNIQFMFNGNLSYTEQDRLGTLGPTGEKRSATSLYLQGGARWLPTTNDTVTFMTFHQGKQLSGEGYRDPFGMLQVAYEHKFNPRLSLNLRASDVLRSTDQHSRIDTDILRQRTDLSFHQRRVYVGLRYTFGGTTGNDAVRNALQQAGVDPNSEKGRDIARIMQAAQGQAPQTQPAPAQAVPAQAAQSQAPATPAAQAQPAPQQPQPATQQ